MIRPRRAVILLLISAAIGVLAFESWRRFEPRSNGPFADLVTAVGDARPIRARLTGGFAYGTPREVTRGAPVIPSPDVRIAAAELEKLVARDESPAALRAHGVARLVSGDVDEALEHLRAARARAPDDATILSDLSAAHLAAAERQNEPASEHHVRALDAATAATHANPALAEAWFNRALATSAILPPQTARKAWDDYLRVDGGSAWAREARDHAAGQPPAPPDFEPQSARERLLDDVLPAWAAARLQGDKDAEARSLATARELAAALRTRTGDPFAGAVVDALAHDGLDVARAYVRFKAGRAAHDRMDIRPAEAAFAEARRHLPGDHPFGCWLDVQRAAIAFEFRNIPQTRALLVRPLRTAQARGYRVCVARARRLEAVALHQANRIDDAVRSYSAAAHLFAELGEFDNELSAYTALSDNLRLRGDRRGSWRYVLTVLARSHAMRSPITRYVAYYNAALFATDEDLRHAAVAFQNQALEEAREGPTPVAVAEGLITRAWLLHRLDRKDDAERDLAEADRIVTATGNDEYMRASLASVAGERAVASEPQRAIEALTRAADYFRAAEPAQYGRLLLMRGRAYLAAGRIEAAMADFEAGIRDFETRRLAIKAYALRVSYFDQSWELFTEMIHAHLRAGRPDTAFAYAERGRARALLDDIGAPVATLDELQRELPADIVLLSYRFVENKVVCWVVTREDWRVIDLAAPASAIERAAQELRIALDDPDRARQDNRARPAARELYAQVFAPVASLIPEDAVVVIVPDGALHHVPFAALIDGHGRHLVEQHPLAVAPSAGAYVAARARGLRKHPTQPALLVADPEIDGRSYPNLPPLPGARREVAAIAQTYKGARILRGAEATAGAFTRLSRGAELIHFAGHALANPDYPLLSTLLFAPDASSTGGMYAPDIAQLDLTGTRVVVLAACDTARGEILRGEGPQSLARPFLAAGAASVIATLWQVDDAASSELFARFHQHLRDSGDPARALQRAQVELLRTGGELARLRAWAGAIAVGAAAPVVTRSTGVQRGAF